jgi:hypothetical protein
MSVKCKSGRGYMSSSQGSLKNVLKNIRMLSEKNIHPHLLRPRLCLSATYDKRVPCSRSWLTHIRDLDWNTFVLRGDTHCIEAPKHRCLQLRRRTSHCVRLRLCWLANTCSSKDQAGNLICEVIGTPQSAIWSVLSGTAWSPTFRWGSQGASLVPQHGNLLLLRPHLSLRTFGALQK